MITGIVMASGFSKRMKRDKLLLEIKNKKVIERVLDSCVNSKLDDIILVYRKDELKDMAKSYGIRHIKNQRPELGQSESVKLGFENADKKSKGVMFIVGDQPFLDSTTINKLIDEFMKDKTRIIIPIYDKNKGNPTIFPYSLKDEFEKLEGDVGGREIISKNLGSVKYIEIENHIAGRDMDTQEDYEKLKGGL